MPVEVPGPGEVYNLFVELVKKEIGCTGQMELDDYGKHVHGVLSPKWEKIAPDSNSNSPQTSSGIECEMKYMRVSKSTALINMFAHIQISMDTEGQRMHITREIKNCLAPFKALMPEGATTSLLFEAYKIEKIEKHGFEDVVKCSFRGIMDSTGLAKH